jgi:hypothetical protein
VKVEVPLGDVVDKVTILRIKRDEIGTDAVRRELASLLASWASEDLPPLDDLTQYHRLAEVNRALWDVEDALRRCESQNRFDGFFIEMAQSVYRLNDERAALKRAINADLGSNFVEQKSYAVTSKTKR